MRYRKPEQLEVGKRWVKNAFEQISDELKDTVVLVHWDFQENDPEYHLCGRSLQLGEGWHSSRHTVRFWNPLVWFQKETDARCYASTTAYAMMIPACNACSARWKRPTHSPS